MEKVRIGNDLKVNFSVYRNGEPESFDGATNISTKIVNESYNKTIAHTYSIVDNVIQFNIDALELKQCGKCRVFISYTKVGDYTVDSPAFELVQYTEDTGGTEVIGIEIVKINISGDIGINRDGASAYEVWEAYPGNEGKTIEQYFEWLHENPTKVDLDGLNSNLDKMHFKPDTLVQLANIGDVRYSQESRTLEVKVSDTVSLQLGQEMQTRVKNDETIQINNGQMVYINSAAGANPLAKIASTSNTDVAQKTFGMATENIPANGFGAITTEGLVRDINTSEFPEGSMLWLGTNGSVTNIEPVAPAPKISIGMVLRSNANNGVVYVKIRAIARNQKLSDVYAPTLTGGDVLIWNSTTLRFETFNITSALSDKVDTSRTITAGNGLTGGGSLTEDRTININPADDSLTVTADNIKVNTNNTLTSTSTTQPLSANQGKVLNEKVVQVETDLNKSVSTTSNLPYTTNDINVFLYLNKYKGYVRLTDGVIVGYGSEPNFYHTDIIKIDTSVTLRCKIDATTTVAAIAFYDINGVYISGIANAINGIINKPANTEFIRFSFWNETNKPSTYYTQLVMGKLQVDLSVMSKYLQARDQSFQPINEMLKYVSAKFGDNLLNKYDSDYVTGYHLNAVGSVSPLSWATGLAVSNYIPIREGEIIKANTYYVNAGMYICLYDSNKMFVSNVPLQTQNYVIGTSQTKFVRFTLYGSNTFKYIIKKVASIGEEISYIDEGSPIYQYISDYAKETYVDSSINSALTRNNGRLICCDGDSLTWGDLGALNGNVQSLYNYPAMLQAILGDGFDVVNYGVPGAPSATLVANASNYRAREDFTIPATVTPVKFLCSMLRPIDNVVSWAFSPVQSHHDTIGGAKYMYINGIKGSVAYAKAEGDTEYKCAFTRLTAGNAVNVENGDVLFTEEYIASHDADHIIFIGANGGWRLSDASSDNNDVDNINELIGQYNSIINASKNELYIAMSYWQWVGAGGSGAWVGEDMFATAFGNHYLNLRAYFSRTSIQDAVDRGYLPNDGTYPTSGDITAMSNGKIPPSLLVSDGVHLTDVGYRLLGDLIANKYKELIKLKVLGTL